MSNIVSVRRSNDQLDHDRSRVAELWLQHYTMGEIAEIVTRETGRAVSQNMVQNDINSMRKKWQLKQTINYDALMNQELKRLDTLEGELWRAIRRGLDPKTRVILEKMARQAESDGEEQELFLKKVTEIADSGVDNPGIFAQIADVQKERRRLLGLYAAKNINVNQHVTVKGYRVVSPDDWDDNAIEGEYSYE
jgi:hypothetical protein